MVQASQSDPVPRISADFELTVEDFADSPSSPIDVAYHIPEEEIAYGPACWLWDYLRRSGVAGYFLPISGGADSSSVATIVGSMCQMVAQAAQADNQQVIRDARRITRGRARDSAYLPTDPREFANRIFYTCYMATRNSSKATRNRAKQLTDQIGSYHLNVNIDSVVAALYALFVGITGKTPKFKVEGGTAEENNALQNIQARIRMTLAYLMAQLLPWTRGKRWGIAGSGQRQCG